MMLNSIVWSSDLIIWDESYLSTLCVFYDEVLLPAVTNLDGMYEFRKKIEFETGEETYYLGQKTPVLYDDPDRNMPIRAEFIHMEWEKRNNVLFKEGVIKRLQVPQDIDILNFINDSLYREVKGLLKDLFMDFPDALRSEHEIDGSFFFWKDHIIHLLRTDINEPCLFAIKQQQIHREVIKSLIALKSFNYLLPKLSKLHPEQILEVRREVATNREGFSFHLQSLSYEVETRIKEGDSIEEIKRYASSVAETKLIPDFIEFKRQIESKRAGFWGKVLDKASSIAEIDATIFSPKFFADLIKIFGLTLLTRISEKEGELSNKGQTFKLIHTIERKIGT